MIIKDELTTFLFHVFDGGGDSGGGGGSGELRRKERKRLSVMARREEG